MSEQNNLPAWHRYLATWRISRYAPYHTSGTYEAPYKTKHGCDSVYHLYVRFFATHLIQFDTTVCASSLPVHWRGRDYYQPGLYSDPLQTIDHTDSVYQMNLTVLPTYTFHRTIDLCDGSR